MMKEYTKKEEFLPIIHTHCLGIVSEIDKICRKNNIYYSLCGGSVIGAHLFKGFIPWDDDIDLMMTRENYNKFLRVFPIQAKENYQLLNYRIQNKASVPTLFSRVQDINTEVDEVIAKHQRTGHIFVDITVMDNVKSSFMHKCAFVYGSYVYMLLYKLNGMIPHTPWKKILFNLATNNKKEDEIVQKYQNFEKYCSKYSHIKTEVCAELLSAAYSRLEYNSKIFNEYIDVDFEGIKLMMVKDYMDYLFSRYHRTVFSKEVPENQRFNSHMIAVRIKSDEE